MGKHTHRSLAVAGLLLLGVGGGCTFDKPADVASTVITLVSGDGQSATVGAALAMPLVVLVEDPAHNPISNFTVDFAVTAGGGSLSQVTVRTDAQGQAETTWTLGTTSGVNTVEATGTGADSVVAFTSTGLAGAAVRIVAASGTDQTSTVASALAQPLVALAEDMYGNPVPGVATHFAVTAGGGSVSPPDVTTGANGQAETTLTLGAVAGANRVEATGAGLTSAPAIFDAIGAAGAATQLVLTSGNLQSGLFGSPVAAPLVVTAKDAAGNPAAGAMVTFVATAGGGAVSTASVATNAQGKAQTAWTLGPAAGTNTVEARATGLAGSPIVFMAVGAGFAPHVDFPTGLAPLSVAIGDLNGDGKPDLAVANSSLNSVSVLLDTTATGATTPSFATKVNFPTGGSSTSVAIGDLNGDGKPDLAVANANGTSSTVSVLLNTTAAGATTPSFATKVDFPTGSSSGSVAIGDLNGDGKPDLAVANQSANTVSVLLNTTATGATTPSIATKVDFPTAFSPVSVAIGDVNGDGKPDLAVATSLSTVSVLLNMTAAGATTPSLATKVDLPTGSNPFSVDIGDLNADGKPDLAVANGNGNTVSVLFNTTAAGAMTPSFAATVDFPTGSNPASVDIGDLNGDGKPDLAVANASSSTVSVLLDTTATGATTPSFATKVDFPTGSNPFSVAIGDFNGDGKPDLAVANRGADTVSVLLGP